MNKAFLALARRLRAERAQTSAEYLGLTVLILAILAVVLSTGIGDVVAAKIKAQIVGMATDGGAGGGGGPNGGGPGGAGGAPGQPGATSGQPGATDGQPGASPGQPGADGVPAAAPPGDAAPAPAEGAESDEDDGGGVLGGIGDAFSGAVDAGGDLVGGTVDAADGALDGAGDFASGAIDAGGDLLSGADDALSVTADMGGAFFDGLIRGDFGGARDSPWQEGFRGAGQFVSGLIAVGDIRDGAAAIGTIVSSGGSDGWGDLGLSAVGIVPIVGDLAKGAKAADGVVDVARGADRANDARRGTDGAAAARRAPDCATNSFTAATPVLTAGGGAKAIALVSPGDRVLATDPETGATGARAVEQVIVGDGRKVLVRVKVGGKVLTATDRHPFWVADRRAWVDAEDLRRGERLTRPNGSLAPVESVRVLPSEPERVYNLTVAGTHTFYAGARPVLVHNANCPKGKKVSTKTDPVARRVKLRKSTQKEIQDAAPKTPNGDYVDPNTRKVIPKDGPYDYGHRRSFEWKKTKVRAREEGWTREQVIEYENNPSHYQIEDPPSNRGHKFEEP